MRVHEGEVTHSNGLSASNYDILEDTDYLCSMLIPGAA